MRTKQRDALRAFLTEQGIGTAVHYPHRSTSAYLHLGYAEAFPSRWSARGPVLSLHQGITEAEVAETIAAVKAFFDRKLNPGRS